MLMAMMESVLAHHEVGQRREASHVGQRIAVEVELLQRGASGEVTAADAGDGVAGRPQRGQGARLQRRQGGEPVPTDVQLHEAEALLQARQRGQLVAVHTQDAEELGVLQARERLEAVVLQIQPLQLLARRQALQGRHLVVGNAQLPQVEERGRACRRRQRVEARVHRPQQREARKAGPQQAGQLLLADVDDVLAATVNDGLLLHGTRKRQRSADMREAMKCAASPALSRIAHQQLNGDAICDGCRPSRGRRGRALSAQHAEVVGQLQCVANRVGARPRVVVMRSEKRGPSRVSPQRVVPSP